MRQVSPDFHNLRQIGRIRYKPFGLTVGQTIHQGIGAEQGEKRYGHGTDLIGRNMTEGGFRALRQENPQSIPEADI